MISSCKQCRKSCCKTGPGPYKEVSPKEYVKNFGDVASYNTKCSELVGGKCRLWGTSKLDSDCRIYVCHNRQYSKRELKIIASISADRCPKCKAKYIIYTPPKWRCEVCGAKGHE